MKATSSIRQKLIQDYWVNKISTHTSDISVQSNQVAATFRSVEKILDVSLQSKIELIASGNPMSEFVIFMSIYRAVLYKYYGPGKSLIASPVFAMNDQEGNNEQILYYDISIDQEDSIKDVLNHSKSEVQQVANYMAYNYATFLDRLNDLNVDPRKGLSFGIYHSTANAQSGIYASCPLQLKIERNGENRIVITFVFDQTHELPFVKQLIEHYCTLLSCLHSDLHLPIKNLSLLSENEVDRITKSYNQTHRSLSESINIVSLFEQQAAKNPEKTALVFEAKKLNYENINERSNQLAHLLIDKGIKANDPVGVMLNRSEWSVIAMLAIFKSGGAYLPIDPSFPEKRIQFILEDAQPRITITENNVLINNIETESCFINYEELSFNQYSNQNPECKIDHQDSSYLIYTSGTTGLPKGVVQTHRTLINLIKWQEEHTEINPQASFLQYSSFSFDVSLQDVCFCLCLGGCLHVASEELKLDFGGLANYIVQQEIQTISLPCSALGNLFGMLSIDAFDGHVLEHIITAGEQLWIGNQLEIFLQKNPKLFLHNHYGPSETHVVTTWSIRAEDCPIPKKALIGTPISNSQIYILDRNFNPVPEGVVGEIYIGGANLAKEYLNQQELTSSKFIPNTFDTSASDRLYRSGDQGMWLYSGEIEFLGRLDQQVKIRGYRVEPSEVENTIMKLDSIEEVIVLTRKVEENLALAVYYTSQEPLGVQKIRSQLQDLLPSYMVPDYFIQLDQLPLTSNGKIDKQALPHPAKIVDGERTEYVAPRNKLEQELVSIWEDVLAYRPISIDDNFFKLGGHSLKAMRVISRIHKDLNLKLELREIFQQPTIKELSQILDTAQTDSYSGIKPIPIQSDYGLSYSQRRLWLINQMDPAQVTYNLPFACWIEGELDRELLQGVFVQLIKRHESLRTYFILKGKTPRQVIVPSDEIDFHLQYEDLRGWKDHNLQVKKIAEIEVLQAFELGKAPLIKARLLQVKNDEYALLLTFHHIISDGWSMEIFMRELSTIYNALKKQLQNPLAPLSIQYKDYAYWQNEQISSTESQTHQSFWLDMFKGSIPKLSLPTDFPRPHSKRYQGAVETRELPPELSQQLLHLSQEQGVSLFMLLLTAFKTILYRYSGQEDLVVGCPIAGRVHSDLEDQIGFYVNTLALRSQLKGSYSFREYLEIIKEKSLQAFAHQVYPFDLLVEQINVERDLSRSALFDVMLTVQNTPADAQNQEDESAGLDGLKINDFVADMTISRFDLELNVWETDQQLVFSLNYDTDLFLRPRIQRLLGHLEVLLSEVVADINQPLESVNYLSLQEKNILLKGFNSPVETFDSSCNLISHFEEEVLKNPTLLAISDGEASLSYLELNTKANKLADYLLTSCNILPGDRVAVMTGRNIDMLVSLIGILKSGATYVPIDLEYPEHRINYMISDAEVSIVITDQTSSIRSLIPKGIKWIDLKEEASEIQKCSATQPSISVLGDQLAYLIYTSGSTGDPKGVKISHKNAAAFLDACMAEFSASIFEEVCAVTSICFDLSIFELFYPLSIGKRIRLLSSGLDLVGYLRKNIDKQLLVNTVPSMVETLLLEDIPMTAIRVLNLAGEPIPPYVQKRLDYNDMEVRNLYGPSEDTTYSTCLRMTSKEDFLTIGRPLLHKQAYILDRNHQLQGQGIIGEICLSGLGVSDGYWKKDLTTAEKFIPSPFEQGKILYKTGDLGRWREDGTIEFLGRMDSQIKIRGFRIELGEIENALSNQSGIERSLIILQKTSTGEPRLVGYFTSNETVAEDNLLINLKAILPTYMIPDSLVKLAEFPLTPNGKIDKNLLESQSFLQKENTPPIDIEPCNEIEIVLKKIWEEVLNQSNIGVKDNFFSVGGHSLKAVQVVSRIHKELGVELNLRILFQHPTIRELASFIKKEDASVYHSIKSVAKQDDYPLSYSQRRLWVIQKLNPKQIAYNMTFTCWLDGPLNKHALRHAFSTLIERHESLRTVFVLVDDEPRQKIIPADQASFQLIYEDLIDNQKEIHHKVEEEALAPFDLSTYPLLRSRLFRTEERRHLFAFTLHHIIGDAWSIEILIKEIYALYNAYRKEQTLSLAPLKIHYKDYAYWQQTQLSGERLLFHQEYWLKQFKGKIPVLSLPTDFPRPTIREYHGSDVVVEISPELTVSLNHLAQSQELSLYMVLLAGLKALLFKYTGQTDMVVGCPVAGRDHADLEEQIGFYVNTLALRSRFNAEDSFSQLLKTVKETTLAAYEHQIYPFDVLVEEVQTEREMSRNPLFDILFTLQNVTSGKKDEVSSQMDDISISSYWVDQAVSKFDWSFELKEMNNGISVRINYDSSLFSKARMERLCQHYVQLLQVVVENIELPIQKINYITEQEQEQLFYQFNEPSRSENQAETIVDLFEKQCKETPDGLAITDENQTLNYLQLNQQANLLAHDLINTYNVQPRDKIGLLMEHSAWTSIAMLGILKAGCTYIPINTEYPENRIKQLLEDADITALISTNLFRTLSTSIYEGPIIIPELQSYAVTAPIHNPEINKKGVNIAYIMYSSSSTGKPEGVMIRHKGVVTRVKSTSYYSFSNEDRLLQTSVLATEISALEIWGLLLNGGHLFAFPKDKQVSPASLKALIHQHQINVIWMTASRFNAVVDESLASLESLQTLLLSGESFSYLHIDKFRQTYSHINVINGYGPIENTGIALSYHVPKSVPNPIPIGYPVAETHAYVLDSNLSPVPIGVAGELFLGGDGLATGYLNQPKLSRDRFISDPFHSNQTLYKTGDLVAWNEDGSIQYIGRKDNQIQLEGFKVELSEVEHFMQSHPEVGQAVVIIREKENGEKRLIGLYDNPSLSIEALESFLGNHLPVYMIPTQFHVVDNYPLDANGEIDIQALELEVNPASEDTFIPPQKETEHMLTEIWEEVLNQKGLGINSNFFQLGGHSLKAVRVLSKIHKIANIELELKDLFKSPTIKELANVLDQRKTNLFEPIEPISNQDFYILSHAQRRLWIMHELDPDKVAYNMPFTYVLHGKVNIEALKNAFEGLLARHEILRTELILIDDTPFQKVQSISESKFELQYSNFSKKSQAELDQVISKEALEPFDLLSGPLFRAHLIQQTEECFTFLLTMHHIISDGWSMGVLMRDLSYLYNAFSQERFDLLEPLNIQYKDFAYWQQKQLSGEKLILQKAYWQTQFEGVIPVLALPTDFTRPSIRQYKGAVKGRVWDKLLSQQIRQLAIDQEVSLYMLLLAALKSLLYRYTGQEDIVIGCPTAGRGHEDLNDQIGFFVNTLALRTKFDGKAGFSKLLAQVKQTTLEGFSRETFPFDALVEELSIKRDLSRSPLFDVMFTVQNDEFIQEETEEVSDFSIEIYSGEITVSKFDLDIDMRDLGEELQISITYDTDLFHADRIDRMFSHYEQLLRSIVQNDQTPLNEITYLSPLEKETLLEVFNKPFIEYPINNILTLLESSAKEFPQNEAIVCGSQRLTYANLHEKSNQLAHYLRTEKQIQPEERIGVLMTRSSDTIIAVLGVLKSGAAYVPIDPEYPAERVHFILKDSQSKLLLTDLAGFKSEGIHTQSYSYDLLMWDDAKVAIANYSIQSPSNLNQSTDLAYLMYTSGSTGVPKGVMISHKAMGDYVSTFIDYFSLSSKDIVLQQASLSFDTSVEEIFPTLAIGARLVMLPEGGRDIEELIRLIDVEKVSIASTTPLVINELNQIQKTFPSLRVLISGGDKLNWSQVDKLVQEMEVYNTYGPTESTVCATFGLVSKHPQKRIPIGKPITNRNIHILDSNQRLVPIGYIGEICISGKGLAKGYWNRKDLTKSCFIPHPFNKDLSLYRTGDLGKWLEDGRIEFVGRTDQQVKIQGYRIEQAEVEQTILSYPEVENAAVITQKNADEENYLVGFYQSKRGDLSELRKYLKGQLPAFMIPKILMPLEEIPFTVNGKVNYKELEALTLANPSSKKHLAPRNKIESQLVDIWKEVLDLPDLSIRDNFFELGGHSIKVMRIVNHIKRSFGLALSFKMVFQHPSIEELAQVIVAEGTTSSHKIAPIPKQDSYEVSHGQKGLFLKYKYKKIPAPFNMYTEETFEDIDSTVLSEAISLLVTRHESLRTTFEFISGEIKQSVHPPEYFQLPIEQVDCRKELEPEETFNRLKKEKLNQIFRLEEGPLFSILVCHLNQHHTKVGFVIDHIISDAWSIDILKKELSILYEALVKREKPILPALPIQNKDFAHWQTIYLQSLEGITHQSYWAKRFEVRPKPLSLPLYKKSNIDLSYTSRLRKDIKSHFIPLNLEEEAAIHGTIFSAKPLEAGKSCMINIPEKLYEGLKQRSIESETSIFSLVISSINLLMYKLTRQTDIVVGTPVNIRNHPDLDSLIGWFLDTLLLRNSIDEQQEVGTFVKSAHDTLLDAMEHRQYPFERLLADLDLSTDAVGQIFVHLIEYDQAINPYVGLNQILHRDEGTPTFDLNFTFHAYKDTLLLVCDYRDSLFSKAAINYYIKIYFDVLRNMINHFDEKVSQILELNTSTTEKKANQFSS